MKTITKLSFCVAVALCVTTLKIQAATSERLLTIALSGFDQFVDQNTGDDVAVPFRLTTKDILARITDATGTNVDGAVLVVIDSLDDTNAMSQIVARTATFQLDVTDFFRASITTLAENRGLVNLSVGV